MSGNSSLTNSLIAALGLVAAAGQTSGETLGTEGSIVCNNNAENFDFYTILQEMGCAEIGITYGPDSLVTDASCDGVSLRTTRPELFEGTGASI